MDKVYRLLGRPISVGTRAAASSTTTPRRRCRSHTYASLAREVVRAGWPRRSTGQSLLNAQLPAAGRGGRRRRRRAGVRRLLPGAGLRRLRVAAGRQPPATCIGRDRRCGGRSSWCGPSRRDQVRPDGAGVEVDRAVGHGAGRPASIRLASFSLRSRDAALFMVSDCGRRRRRTGSRGRCRRLAGYAADGLGELGVVDAVQDHLGDGDLALERLAARLEVDGLRQALLLGVPADGRHGSMLEVEPGGRGRLRRCGGGEFSGGCGSRSRLATTMASAERAIGRIDCERAETRAPAEDSRAACSGPSPGSRHRQWPRRALARSQPAPRRAQSSGPLATPSGGGSGSSHVH